MKKPRLLKAEEIDVRVAQIHESEKGNSVSLLLYKDARVDQNILDETFEPENWQRSHQVIEGRLYCTVSIWDAEKKCWVSKQDVGTESNEEKEKGQASDSFKRACFNWGIGRELYTAPFIWVGADKCNIKKSSKGKLACYDKFIVEQILYDEKRTIVAIAIKNITKNVRCFVFDNRKKA